MRPLWALRNLVLLGDIMAQKSLALRGLLGRALILRERVLNQDFALENPDLHTARAVGGLGSANTVIQVGAQRVQRHAAFTVPLDAGNLGAAQTAGAGDLDPLRAKTHRRLHGALHRTAERHTALQLLGDVLGHQRGVDLRLADLHDVQGDVSLRHRRQFLAQAVDVLALLADHHARTRGIDRHARLLGRALDDNLRHAGLSQLAAQVIAQLDVVMQQLGVVLASIPAAVPGAGNAEAQANRINLVTHNYAPSPAAAATALPRPGFTSRGAAAGASRSSTTI